MWPCSDSNNSVGGLKSRYVDIADDGTATLHILKEYDRSEILPILDVSIECSIAASLMIHRRFGDGADVVDDLAERWNEIRHRPAANLPDSEQCSISY